MTQMTGAISACGAKVEISSNCSDYTDISGYVAGISFTGMDRETGKTYTFDGDVPIVEFGKLTDATITIKLVYEEVSTDPFATFWTQHTTACGGSLCVRWSPKSGDTAGEYRYTTATDAKITGLLPPDGEAGPGNPLMAAAKIVTSAITRAVVT